MIKLFRIKLKFILTSIFVLCWNFSISQSIKGTVYSIESSEPIHQAVVEIYADEEHQELILAYALTALDGTFEIDLTHLNLTDNSFLLVVKKMDFQEIQEVLSLEELEDSNLNFFLEASFISLSPLVVKGSVSPIRQRSDTILYNVDSFRDGSERVLEDILKNLPGIDVNDETGIIKYKGMNIDKLLIEGSDLFDKNYTAGSRNISSDIIKEIEAIENWTENEILKGISNENKIALNIKLRKGSSDFSGRAILGGGFSNKTHIGVSGVNIAQRNKFFFNSSFNNIGKNNSTTDYLSMFHSQMKDWDEESELSARFIAEEYSVSNIPLNRLRQNNLFFNTLNNVFTINENTEFRIIYSYTQDFLTQTEEQNQTYFLESDNLNTYSWEDFQRKPKLSTLNLNLKWQNTETSNFEFESDWMDEKIWTNKNQIINQFPDIQTQLASKSYHTSNKITYTKKLNDLRALVLESGFSSNSLPQELVFSPAIDFDEFTFKPHHNTIQTVHSQRDKFFLKSKFMGFLDRGNNFESNVSVIYDKENLHSFLNETNQNDLKYTTLITNLDGQYNFNLFGLSVTPRVSVKNYQLNLINPIHDTERETNKFIINPRLSIVKELELDTQFALTTSYDQSPQNLQSLYSDFILSPDRVLRRNNAEFNFSKTFVTAFQFKKINLLKYYEYEFKMSYLNFKNRPFVNTEIYENFRKVTYFHLPESNELYQAEGSFEQFLAFLSSTARVTIRYNKNNFKNIVNNSELRDISSNAWSMQLNYKTGFEFPLNFENKTRWFISNYSFAGSESRQSTSFSNQTRALFKPNNQFSASVSMDYYNQKSKTASSIYFLDFQMQYKPQNGIVSYSLEGKNLLGQKDFVNYAISDIFEIHNKRSLNPRFLLLTIFVNL